MAKEKTYPLPCNYKEHVRLMSEVLIAFTTGGDTCDMVKGEKNLRASYNAYKRATATAQGMQLMHRFENYLTKNGFTFDPASGDYITTLGAPEGHQLHLFLDRHKRPIGAMRETLSQVEVSRQFLKIGIEAL